MFEVVAISYGEVYEVRNPASLVNHDVLMVDDEIVLTNPLEPRVAKPCESCGRSSCPELLTSSDVPDVEPITNWFDACPAIGLIANCANGVEVEIPTLPQNCEIPVVVVASKLPTVSCVPVACKLPLEFVVTIELIGNVLAKKIC